MWLAVLSSTAWAWTLGVAHDVEPVVLEEALYTWEIGAGTVYDVLDEEGQRSGFVFVGRSELHLQPGTNRDAQALANRLVAHLEMPTEDARAVGMGGSWSMDVDGAVVLGASAWDAVAPVVSPIILDADRVPVTRDATGIETVLVERRRRIRRDRRRAETWLHERTRWMDEVSIEPAGIIQADRWEQEAGTDAPDRWIASLLTDVDWGLYAGDRIQPRVPQPWLELIRDRSGVLDPGASTSAWASGPEGPRVRVARGGWPTGIPTRHVNVRRAELLAYFIPYRSAMGLEVGIRADLDLVAMGGPAAHIVLDLPHTEQRTWYSAPPIPHGFEVVSVEGPDGPLEVAAVSIGPQDETRGDTRTLAIRLASPLAEGDTRRVRVTFRDRHRFAHVHDYNYGQGRSDIHGFGSATGLVRVLPELRSHRSERYPVQVKAGVGPGAGRDTHVITSHGRAEKSEDDNGKWVTIDADSHGLRLGVGDWLSQHRPAAESAPSHGLHPFSRISEFDRVADGLSAMLYMYQAILPDFPHDHLELAENFRDPYGGLGLETGDATLMPGESQHHSTRISLFGGSRLAAGLHEQWWMPLDIQEEDAMLPVVSTWLYTLAGMRAIDGDKDTEAAWRRLRATIPARTGWSGTRSETGDLPSLAIALGPVLTADAGGDAVLFAAVDKVLMGHHPASWDGLADALEDATGRDWRGFLLTWVHSRTTPGVTVHYWVEGDALVGEVDSDLPFGSFRLPVQMGSGRDRLRGTVTVIDGRADFTWPLEGRNARLVVNPDNTLPLRRLQVVQGPPSPG